MDPLDVVSEKTRRAYDLVAARYHELFAAHFDGTSLVCDAGCGPSGHIGRHLFDKGIPVLGVDISGRCVELARAHNPDMRFERCDMAAMPFPDGKFGGVIAYYSIIDTPKRHVGVLFREMHRVLAPGGRLLVAVKAGTSEGYLTELLGTPTEIYFSLFTQDEIQRYFEEALFEVELLEQRDPYGAEIEVERIFAVGRKGPR